MTCVFHANAHVRRQATRLKRCFLKKEFVQSFYLINLLCPFRRLYRRVCVCVCVCMVGLTLILLMWRIQWTPNSIPIYSYIQQDYTVYLYLETALHVSGGTSTHHQERIQLYLQHLPVWVCCGWRTPPTTHSNRFQIFHDSGR